MDMTLYALLNKKIKGVISGVDSVQVKNQNLVFNFTDGSTQIMAFPTPADGKDGASIIDINVNAANHLICTMSDNTTIDAGIINTVQGERGPAGENGKDGTNGKNGQDGIDGISPIVTITESTGRHTVSITDKEGVKSFVVKDGSALDVENYYTKDEVNIELDKKANAADLPIVPANLSEFNNDEKFIKNTVDNLIHYYNKANTYTQAEVNNLIANIQKLTSQIVTELPIENIDTSVIYLMKQEDSNSYMQYMYINSDWAELGTTQVDLTDYYNKSEIDSKLAEKADKTELPTIPTVISAFTNDAKYLTEYTETDPTVPAWAKAETKPTYTAAEVGALPEDTEVPIFTNKQVLDKFTEEDNKVLYNNKPLASDNLWHGTQEEYDALGVYDENKTYIITDGSEDIDLSSMVIDDTSITATDKTWSASKIKDYIDDISMYISEEGETYIVQEADKPKHCTMYFTIYGSTMTIFAIQRASTDGRTIAINYPLPFKELPTIKITYGTPAGSAKTTKNTLTQWAYDQNYGGNIQNELHFMIQGKI